MGTLNGRPTLAEIEHAAASQRDMISLAIQIADDAARADIECNCVCVRSDSEPAGPHWYDTRQLDGSVTGLMGIDLEQTQKTVSVSLRYLDLRGHIERDPMAPHVVSFH